MGQDTRGADTPEGAGEAGRRLGSIRTERKAESSRANILAAKAAGKNGGRPRKAVSDYACTCGRGEGLAGHPTTCPRGRAIWKLRRQEERPAT